jgi:glycosyltransferase involved in cell wall biosynthesis
MPEFSVLVPSVGRPECLTRSLDDLLAQDFPGDYEILVIHRSEDRATLDVTTMAKKTSARPLHAVAVDGPGIVRALRTGLAAASGELIAFCDDDARYPVNWLLQLHRHFNDPTVGGVGGMIKEGGEWAGRVSNRDVCRVGWFGRVSYNVRAFPTFHTPQAVDMLPGANMSYRRCLLTPEVFNPILDGKGCSPGFELAVAWHTRRQGYLVKLDPTITVDHYSAPWFDGERRPSADRTYTYSRNLSYIMLFNLGEFRLLAFLSYFILVGQWESPGLILWVVGALTRRIPHERWLTTSVAGKCTGAGMAAIARRRKSNSTAADRVSRTAW